MRRTGDRRMSCCCDDEISCDGDCLAWAYVGSGGTEAARFTTARACTKTAGTGLRGPWSRSWLWLLPPSGVGRAMTVAISGTAATVADAMGSEDRGGGEHAGPPGSAMSEGAAFPDGTCPSGADWICETAESSSDAASKSACACAARFRRPPGLTLGGDPSQPSSACMSDDPGTGTKCCDSGSAPVGAGCISAAAG